MMMILLLPSTAGDDGDDGDDDDDDDDDNDDDPLLSSPRRGRLRHLQDLWFLFAQGEHEVKSTKSSNPQQRKLPLFQKDLTIPVFWSLL